MINPRKEKFIMLKGKFAERIKGIAIGIIITTVFMAAAIPAFASARQEAIIVHFNNIRIAVDGRVVQTENEPFIHNERTYLPMRDAAEAMGFDVTWEGATNTVHLTSRTSGATPNYPPHNPITPVPPIGEITPNPTPGGNQNNRPSNPAISMERAIEIANADLAARNISATFRANSGMSWERGQWVWELEFRPATGRGVIEYYINVNTGAIVKFEWDS